MAHENEAMNEDAVRWLVWDDKSVYALRRSKTAANLKAVSLKLAEIEPLREADARFQANYETLCGFPGPVLQRLFEDPYSYYWTRVAFELTRTWAQGGQPDSLAAVYCSETALNVQDALMRHLDDFARLLVGAALLAGKELELPVPLEVSAPFTVPGSVFSFNEPGSLQIYGCDGEFVTCGGANGVAEPAVPGRSPGPGGATVDVCPHIVSDGHDILLQPAMLAVPLEKVPKDACSAPMKLQWSQKPSIESALQLVGRLVPEIHAQLFTALRAIIVYDSGDGEPYNGSHCDLPGLMIVNRVRRLEDYGIILIHEFYHSRLFALEEKALFFEQPVHMGQTMHYSPWRNEPRPMHGVLHAVYVHLPVARFLSKLLEATDEEEIRMVTRSRLVKANEQLKLGIEQLAGCNFTSSGKMLFHQLERDVAELNKIVTGMGLSPDERSLTFERLSGKVVQHRDPVTGRVQSVRESLESHLSRVGSREEQRRLVGKLRYSEANSALTL